jgi:hypothetical protein
LNAARYYAGQLHQKATDSALIGHPVLQHRSDLEDGGEVPGLEEIRINTTARKIFRFSGESAIELPFHRTTYQTRTFLRRGRS